MIQSTRDGPPNYNYKNDIALDTTQINNNDVIIVTSNMLRPQAITSALPIPKALSMPTTHAIADTGVKSIFIMAGTHMNNVQLATNPLSINLPDGGISYVLPMCATLSSRDYQRHSWGTLSHDC